MGNDKATDGGRNPRYEGQFFGETVEDATARHALAKQCDVAVCEVERLREVLRGIAAANWRTWEELARPDEFVRWAQARANHALQSNAN